MRKILLSLCLSAAISAAPALVAAAPALRGIMHDWRDGARSTNDILTGRADFDEAAIRDVLQAYVADAGRVVAQVNGQTPAARDFKQRLIAFQADAQTALGDLAQRAALQADFTRLMSDCRSCHDAFKD
jgi:cytochrome c556